MKDELKGWISLFIVYIVWGSTYLAIRIAVNPETGFPPFTLVALRLFLSSGFLFLFAFFTKRKFRLKKAEAFSLIASGLLLWIGGNGLVTLAERTVDSGYAALMVATTIIWTTIIEAIWDRKKPSVKIVISLGVGFFGLIILNLPSILSSKSVDIQGIFLLLFATFCWGLGTIIQSRKKVSLSPVVSSAYQQLAGAFGFLFLRTIFNEPFPTPSTGAVFAWLYLAFFGSVLGFTAFVVAVKTLPTKIVMTYSFVNPLVALFLGWLFLREKITLWTAVGTALILLSVFLIYREKFRRKPAKKQFNNN